MPWEFERGYTCVAQVASQRVDNVWAHARGCAMWAHRGSIRGFHRHRVAIVARPSTSAAVSVSQSPDVRTFLHSPQDQGRSILQSWPAPTRFQVPVARRKLVLVLETLNHVEGMLRRTGPGGNALLCIRRTSELSYKV